MLPGGNGVKGLTLMKGLELRQPVLAGLYGVHHDKAAPIEKTTGSFPTPEEARRVLLSASGWRTETWLSSVFLRRKSPCSSSGRDLPFIVGLTLCVSCSNDD